ncbi:unnamed protein product [Ectocarpus sp. 6 AP-2014]
MSSPAHRQRTRETEIVEVALEKRPRLSSRVLGTSSPDPPVSREGSPSGPSPSDCGYCWGLPPIFSSARASKGSGGKSPSGSSGGSAIDNDSGDNGERSPHPGGSRCFDALAIALNQAYRGEREYWYKSALQLQLVCLAFCGACQSVPTWHLRIDDQTPESLWDPNVCISSRVPAVMALRLTWVYGRMNDFVLDAGDRQWKCLEVLRLDRFKSRSCPDRPKPTPIFDQEESYSLSSTVWPPSLRQLEFGDGFTVRITTLKCPPSLQQLSIGHWCDERIACPGWPMSLQKISFSGLLDQPITRVVWPTSLREFSFGEFVQTTHRPSGMAIFPSAPIFRA